MICGNCGSQDYESHYCEERGHYEGVARCHGRLPDGKPCGRVITESAEDLGVLIPLVEAEFERVAADG